MDVFWAGCYSAALQMQIRLSPVLIHENACATFKFIYKISDQTFLFILMARGPASRLPVNLLVCFPLLSLCKLLYQNNMHLANGLMANVWEIDSFSFVWSAPALQHFGLSINSIITRCRVRIYANDEINCVSITERSFVFSGGRARIQIEISLLHTICAHLQPHKGTMAIHQCILAYWLSAWSALLLANLKKAACLGHLYIQKRGVN